MAKINETAEHLKDLPKCWQNFFNKFKEIDTLKVSKWKPVHHLGYLSKRYEETYGKKYAFSLQKVPSKSSEVFLIKKIGAMLCTTNQRTIKEYIDWVFDEKIIPKNKKIRSLAFFISLGLGNEFNLVREQRKIITRDTPLPNEYKKVAEEMGISIDTYGDVAFIKQALDISSSGREDYLSMYKKLLMYGFEPSLLEDIK